MRKCFLKSLWQTETQLSIFRKKLVWTVKFSLTNLHISWRSFFLIFLFITIFQRNENRFISLVLKAKQQKAIQLSYIFLKFYINQFSNRFLLFLHFPALWNLFIYMKSSFHVILYLRWKWFQFIIFFYLKLVSAIFSSNDRFQKLWKMFFISSKKLFPFSRYSNFCRFFPSFPHIPDSKGQMDVE